MNRGVYYMHSNSIYIAVILIPDQLAIKEQASMIFQSQYYNFQQNVFETVICKVPAIMFKHQCVKRIADTSPVYHYGLHQMKEYPAGHRDKSVVCMRSIRFMKRWKVRANLNIKMVFPAIWIPF